MEKAVVSGRGGGEAGRCLLRQAGRQSEPKHNDGQKETKTNPRLRLSLSLTCWARRLVTGSVSIRYMSSSVRPLSSTRIGSRPAQTHIQKRHPPTQTHTYIRVRAYMEQRGVSVKATKKERERHHACACIIQHRKRSWERARRIISSRLRDDADNQPIQPTYAQAAAHTHTHAPCSSASRSEGLHWWKAPEEMKRT